ncbi:hypothetical protein TorRG33x02_021320 [Trema orientale]|uniref:Uncharacterized protein n=1 Tax=Trema orientale TaxID=63057 RepID=A0A2P5FX29_TREOI|nr:hypothetical protein TorRG33x02_021320 [Trema orientale]
MAFPYSGAQLSAKTYFIPKAAAKVERGFIPFSSSAFTSWRAKISASTSLSTSNMLLLLLSPSISYQFQQCVILGGKHRGDLTGTELLLLPWLVVVLEEKCLSASMRVSSLLFASEISLSGRLMETFKFDLLSFLCKVRHSGLAGVVLNGDFSILLGRSFADLG